MWYKPSGETGTFVTVLQGGRVQNNGLGRLQVVIADPNRHMRTLLKGVLRAYGVRTIQEANDGADAFKEMNLNPIDVVLVEYQMTPIDGMEFVRLIRRAADSPNPFCPVIMITGHTERHVVETARDLGVHEFLAKPITPEKLYGRLNKVLKKPRPFIQAPAYFGPDRRRRDDPRYKGRERRVRPPHHIPVTPPLAEEEV